MLSTSLSLTSPALRHWTYAPGASAVMALEEALRQIEQWYLLPSPEPVRSFIRRNPSLAALLIEAIAPLYEFFGPAPHVSVRVVPDPEVENYDQLLAYVRVALPAEEARRRLHQLDEVWFLDQLDRAAGKFNFNLEFM